MKFPNVDQYIVKFKDLVRLAGYIVRNEETITFFLNELTSSVLDDVMRPLFTYNYNELREHAIQITKAKQMTKAIRA
jgi:hypothetical protein